MKAGGMPKLRFNHMELTVGIGALDPIRQDVAAFYGDVFGFAARDIDLFDCNGLSLATDPEASQFILIMEQEHPLHSPGYDHLGFIVDTDEELDRLLARCRDWQTRDPRVEIKVYDDLVLEETITRAFYVKYLLPIWFDVQTISARPGYEPQHGWKWTRLR